MKWLILLIPLILAGCVFDDNKENTDEEKNVQEERFEEATEKLGEVLMKHNLETVYIKFNKRDFKREAVNNVSYKYSYHYSTLINQVFNDPETKLHIGLETTYDDEYRLGFSPGKSKAVIENCPKLDYKRYEGLITNNTRVELNAKLYIEFYGTLKSVDNDTIEFHCLVYIDNPYEVLQ